MVRIIAGIAGGRRLTAPSGMRTRPTSDRVREALFSIIASWAGTAGYDPAEMLMGRAFLDLYAGSGAIALEAVSRGAGPVLAVESDRKTGQLIRRNAAQVGLELAVSMVDASTLAASPAPNPFDIIWADPPYTVPTKTVEGLVMALLEHGWIAEDALIIVERSTRDPAPIWPMGLEIMTNRAYGETSLYLATRGNA